jgi:hypothetical protein
MRFTDEEIAYLSTISADHANVAQWENDGRPGLRSHASGPPKEPPSPEEVARIVATLEAEAAAQLGMPVDHFRHAQRRVNAHRAAALGLRPGRPGRKALSGHRPGILRRGPPHARGRDGRPLPKRQPRRTSANAGRMDRGEPPWLTTLARRTHER